MPRIPVRSAQDLTVAIAWTVAETARMIGCSRQYVNRLVNEGRLDTVTDVPRRMDPEHVKAQLRKGFPCMENAAA